MARITKPENQRNLSPVKTYAKAASEEVEKRKSFSNREVGVTHPDLSSFIKLCDNGDIEIMAGPGVGIIISGLNRSISIHADEVKFYTKRHNGFRWNDLSLNAAAFSFKEPTFIRTDSNAFNTAFNGIYDYINDINFHTREEKTKEVEDKNKIFNFAEVNSPFDGLEEAQKAFFKNHSRNHSAAHIDYELSLVKRGYSLEAAHEKTIEDKGK